MCHRPSLLPLLLPVLSALLPALSAQQPAHDWYLPQPFWASPISPQYALHPTTDRPIRFGGQSDSIGAVPYLWEWAGDRWLRHSTEPMPRLVDPFAMVNDTVRRRLVVVGTGLDAPQRSQTWTWDGLSWQQHATPLLLTARTAHAMTFDATRGRVVLFGGVISNGTTALGDTWEWDGTTWHLGQPGLPPPPRSGHRLAFDAARGRTILFGGRSGNVGSDDTWEWDGTSWLRRQPAHRPPAGLQAHAMVGDPVRGRVVLFGGAVLPFPLPSPGATGTWEWDGVDWTPVVTANVPPTVQRHALLFDPTRGRTLLIGPASGGETLWEYDGVDWSPVVAATAPPPRQFGGMTYEPSRNVSVVFGGQLGNEVLGDTWTFDGARWRVVSPALSPQPRYSHAMAHDPVRARTVLFGGLVGSWSTGTSFGDTWLWNGTVWSAVQAANRPSARSSHALAWHAGTQRVVMFGGRVGGAFVDETWTWDGTNWRLEAPASAPSPRFGPAMVGMRQDVVLFGGGVATPGPVTVQPIDDTWRWDGTTWTQLQPAVAPSARYSAACAHDADADSMLLFSGLATNTGVQPNDLWAFDGANWTQRNTITTPIERYGGSMVHDLRLRQTILFGGRRFRDQNDLWLLGPGAEQTAFGSACAGSRGAPAFVASPASIPRPGGVLLAEVQNVPDTLALLAVGFSDTAVGAQPLPLPLGSVGMPGCSLLVSPDAAALLLPVNHVATWTLAIPSDIGLLGTVFFAQAFALDPPANAAGVVASNGLRTRIGN